MLKDDIEQEAVMVAYAYAIVDPRAMMVESLHTSMTYAAVSAPSCPDSQTIRTELSRVKHL